MKNLMHAVILCWKHCEIFKIKPHNIRSGVRAFQVKANILKEMNSSLFMLILIMIIRGLITKGGKFALYNTFEKN